MSLSRQCHHIRSRLLIAAMLLAVAPSLAAQAPKSPQASEQFLTTLATLCGARFEGARTFPTDADTAWAGQVLTATIASCSADEVRVPFAVGANRSRTWVFSRVNGGVQLKHDHRHADGTPDAVTDYGGMATQNGTAWSQHFAADAATAQLIPAARTNVWSVTLAPDGSTLTYHLERDGRPRFTAVLKRVGR